MFGSQRSLVYHSRVDCKLCRVKNPVQLNSLRGKRPCAQCVGKNVTLEVCTACTELLPGFTKFSCGHTYCKGCTEYIVSTTIRGKKSNLQCPCPGTGFLYAPSKDVIDSILAHVCDQSACTSGAKSAIDRLNLECPHCQAVFYDFDGCLALRCSCGGYFCALCLAPHTSNEAVHAHVLNCTLNPVPGEYFVSTNEWEAVRETHRRKTGRALLHERSGMENMSCAYQLQRHGVSVSPVDIDWMHTMFQLVWVCVSASVTFISESVVILWRTFGRMRRTNTSILL